MNKLEHTIVGDVVAADFRAASVFERFGIDFCCGGRRSVAEACRTAAVSPEAVEDALQALSDSTAAGPDAAADWPLDRLIDHIVATHHGYVRTALPAITGFLAKLVSVHGERHPELARVARGFDKLRQDFEQHLVKEERVLFPYIRTLAVDPRGPEPRHQSPFGSVENPIRMMEREHRDAADDLREIRELTNGYTAPEDGCATYRACMNELARFESDLHRHVHLENNVLFPRAVTLEASLVHG